MTVSLIISTYNWPRALYLCLDSVMQQTAMPTEILIADDGSGISTRDVVRHFQNISPVPAMSSAISKRCRPSPSGTSGTRTRGSAWP